MKRNSIYEIKRLVLVALLILSFNTFFSQQMGTRSHYFIQEYLLNPAFTGSKNYNPFYLSYRQQWSGFKDSPEFLSSSGYYIINESSNVSGSFYNSKQGSEFSQTVGQFNYSHDFHFHQNAHLTFGAGLILDQFVADFSGLDIVDPNDPAFANGINVFSMDAALGVKYFLKRFKFGISVANLFESKRSNSVQSTNYNKLPREFRLIGQYDFTIDSSLHLEPLLVYKVLPEIEIQQLDLSLLATYKRAFTLGMSYRSNADLSVIAGVQYKRFYFLYSHEVNTSGLADILGSNSEVTAGYRFKLHPDKIYVDNDMDGIINKKDSCIDLFGTKKHLGCPIDQWVEILNRGESLVDSLIVDDSLMFKFQKLSSEELDLIKLSLVDDKGNVLYKAIKTEDGFIFNYLPYQESYFFKLENLPDGMEFESLQITYNHLGDTTIMLSRLNDTNGLFEYKRILEKLVAPSMINDSLIFTFEKLNSTEIDAVNLSLVDKEGNVLYKAIKTKDGFIFEYLPYKDDYFFNLESTIDGVNYKGLNVQYYENGELKNIFSRFNDSNGFFHYQRLLGSNYLTPKLLLYNDQSQVIDVGYKDEGFFVFKNLNSFENFCFASEFSINDFDTIKVRFYNDKSERQLIFNKLTGFYNFISIKNLIDEKDDGLSMLLKEENEVSSKINNKVIDVLNLLEESEDFIISEEKKANFKAYFSIQIGAYKTQMNQKIYSIINQKYGNKLQILFDDRLQLQKYIVNRYQTFEKAQSMNRKLASAGFKGCFVIGVENNKIVDASYLKGVLK